MGGGRLGRKVVVTRDAVQRWVAASHWHATGRITPHKVHLHQSTDHAAPR